MASARREEAAWLDRVQERDTKLTELLHEMYSALDGDLRVLAAIGVRTAFDRATELLGVEPAISFDDKLRRLVDDGRISGDEKKILAVLVDAGGAAAHRSWRPRRDQLDTMLDAIESFLHRALIVKDGIAKLEAAVPAKQKTRETALMRLDRCPGVRTGSGGLSTLLSLSNDGVFPILQARVARTLGLARVQLPRQLARNQSRTKHVRGIECRLTTYLYSID